MLFGLYSEIIDIVWLCNTPFFYKKLVYKKYIESILESSDKIVVRNSDDVLIMKNKTNDKAPFL